MVVTSDRGILEGIDTSIQKISFNISIALFERLTNVSNEMNEMTYMKNIKFIMRL
jgi:hypothetical protein